MRVECESCGELVAARFAPDPGGVRVTCPVCARAMVVALAAEVDAAGASGAAARAGERADAGACPKCGAARRTGAACPSCGLAVARMASYSDVHDAAVAAPVRAAWLRAVAAWDDPARHEEVLQQVAAHHGYAWAASRYRMRGRDPIAERQLARLRRTAEATLLAGASVRREGARPYRMTRGVLGVLIAAIAAGLFYATLRRPPRPPNPVTVPAPLVPGHPVSPSGAP
jgi:hypothetical protein